MRSLLGFVVGLVLFVVTVWCCEFGFSRIDPPPPGMDPRDPMMLQLLSPLALGLVLLGWAIASLGAGSWAW
jgi:hypothetical protein